MSSKLIKGPYSHSDGGAFSVSDTEVSRNHNEQANLYSMSPHDRLLELSAIIANGIHRLRGSSPASPNSFENPAESPPPALEAVATTRPDGPRCQPERTPEE